MRAYTRGWNRRRKRKKVRALGGVRWLGGSNKKSFLAIGEQVEELLSWIRVNKVAYAVL